MMIDEFYRVIVSDYLSTRILQCSIHSVVPRIMPLTVCNLAIARLGSLNVQVARPGCLGKQNGKTSDAQRTWNSSLESISVKKSFRSGPILDNSEGGYMCLRRLKSLNDKIDLVTKQH